MDRSHPPHPIECRDLWKVFGDRGSEALAAVRAGMSKEDARDFFDCVVGVKEATFSVAQGEIFCIMGLSGSGKSTLLRHVNGLIAPTSGDVLVDGQNVSEMEHAELRSLRARKIGMVFQHMALWPHRTIIDNVAYGLEIRGVGKAERREAALAALETMQLTGWDKHYPDQLSGGMQQRVGLARALCADPDILLMDEPFSALDPLIRRQLQDQFLELSTQMKKTTLFVTHDLDEAIRIGDRIAIMNAGEIVQVGSPEEIATQPTDDYVADFVEGISRLHLIRAETIMERFGAGDQRHTLEEVGSAPRVPVHADLDALIEIAVSNPGPLVVVEGQTEVGFITQRGLLEAIRA